MAVVVSPTTVRLAGQVGPKVRVLREGRSWSQRRLAREAGLSPDTISALERGVAKDLNLETLLRLQAALELCSLEQLLAGSAQIPSQQLALSFTGR